jgi:hypothetical protein
MKRLSLAAVLLMFAATVIASPAAERPAAISHDSIALQMTGDLMPAPADLPIYMGRGVLEDVFLAGADRLEALQNDDGGWDWPLDDGNPANASPKNTIGPIAKGLARAWTSTQDAGHLATLSDAGAFLLSKVNTFSPSDGYLAAQLDMLFSVTIYTDHVKANFYTPLADSTFNSKGLGVLYNTETYVQSIRDSRHGGGIGNLAAWDVGMGIVGASSSGVATGAWVAGTKAEIDSLDGAAYYDVIGLAGALYGLAFVGEEYDPVAGEHTAATNLADLAVTLASYQIDMGGFTWNRDWVIPDDDNETIQETAYSILALDEVDRATYIDEITGAGAYMISVQLATGGWGNWTGGGENNEVTAEALWGIEVASSEISEVWVDDDFDATTPGWGITHFSSIQDGVDIVNGSTVNVAAGTYREQLYIDKPLDLTGAGSGVCTIEAEDAGGRTIYQVTQWNASVRDVDTCVGVFEAGTVNITGFTIDGRDTGPSNFYGVHFFDTSGSMTQCTIQGVTYPASPGAQRVVNLSGSHSDGVAITLDFSNLTMPDFQKGGILLMGPLCTFTVNSNTVSDLYTGAIAGNGIQLSYGASGSTSGNVVQGVGYTGAGWAGTGILLFESGDITMNGDEVFDCQSGVNYSDWRWVYSHPVPVNLSMSNLNLHDNEWTLGAQLSGDQSDLNIDIADCMITGSTADGIDLWGSGVDPWGGSYYTGWQNGDLVATITNCTISGTAAGYDGLWTGDVSGNVNNATVDVHGTSFIDNGNSAVNNDFPSAVIDAELCWWNDAAGPIDGGPAPVIPRSKPMIAPTDMELPASGGSALVTKIEQAGRGAETVYGAVDYTPWLGMGVLDMTPASSGPINCSQSSNLVFNYAPDAFTPALRGYTIRVTATSEVSFTESDITVHHPLADPDYYDIIMNGANDYTIDYAILGTTLGVTGPESFFDITFHGDNAGAHSAATVSFVSCALRGLNNEPIGNDCTATASIDVDCLAPTVPTMGAEPAYTQGLSNTVDWSDESGSGAVLYNAEAATDAGFTALVGNSGWIAGLSHLFGGLTDGQIYYYRVKAKDALDNETAFSAGVFSTQDDSPPVTSADALSTYQTAATFDVAWTGADVDPGSGSFSGLATVELFYSYESGAWTQYGGSFAASPISFTAVDGDGDYEFYTVGTDNVGNVEAAPAGGDATTQLDTTNPVGTFVINADAVYTTTPGVTLNNAITDATSGVNQMRFSDDDITFSAWEAYAATKAWTLPGADGSKTVYAEFSDMAGNVYALNDVIILDTAAPGAVSDADATPGHEKVDLTWTASGDGDVALVEIWRGVWHDGAGASAYPEYDDLVGNMIPARPATRAAADASSEWVLAGTVADPGTTFQDSYAVRGIYHYEFFVKDLAGNYGPPAVDQVRATNYHLGDAQISYDGYVNAGDISVLGAAYGTNDGDGSYNNECDVGPTDTTLGDGIPATDNAIEFEDLMIFAMNYGNVAPMPIFEGSDFAHLSWFALEDGSWALGLTEPCANLKALQLQAQIPSGVEVTLTGGGLLNQQAGPIFLRQIPGKGLDISLAVMGEGVVISGQGLLFSVTLPDGMLPTDLELKVRDAANAELEFELSATEVADLPTVYRLAGNHPNPFNPKTSISFDLPESQNVRLVVFSADGRRIVTLLDEQVNAGRHSVAWSGRDEHGVSVASGVYFARIQAGPLKETHKMLLLK